jgi:hypothetical protein
VALAHVALGGDATGDTNGQSLGEGLAKGAGGVGRLITLAERIDTEGAEYDILQGLCFTPRYLLIEWHSELDRVNIDRWAYARSMMLVKSLVHERHVGVNHYVKEVEL